MENNAKQHDELTFGTTPNYLTLVRMAFVPVVVGFLFVRTPFFDFLAALTFALASITDFLDGYIARSRHVVTIYGKLMDPLADKFLVVSSLVMLQDLGRIHVVIVILLIFRELAITGLRALASAEGVIIQASNIAKAKTVTQMFAIPLIMLDRTLWGVIPLYTVGQVLILISLGISLWSGKDYVVGFFRAMAEKRRQRLEAKRMLKEQKKEVRDKKRSARRKRRKKKLSQIKNAIKKRKKKKKNA